MEEPAGNLGRGVHCTELTVPSCEYWSESSGHNRNATDGAAHLAARSPRTRCLQVPSLVGPCLFTQEPPHPLALSPLGSKERGSRGISLKGHRSHDEDSTLLTWLP